MSARSRNDRGVAGQGSCATGALACIPAEQAIAFVDGQLVAGERAAIEHRIDACVACRAVVAAAARNTGLELVRDAQGRSVVQPASDRTDRRAPVFAAATQALGARGQRAAARRAELIIVEEHDQATPAPPVDRGLVVGEVVGRYIVERPLGAGGMGVVSLARDPELRRPVVIKLVHPNMGLGEGGDELEARLRREAQAMAQVSHPNVVQIFDIGRRGDRVFLAMEFVDGHTLDGWLRQQPRSPGEILAMLCQAGAGLAAAHRAGLVHRDFKPTNVLVGHDGVAKVTDFGLARAVAASAGAPAATRQLRAPVAGAPNLAALHAASAAAPAPRSSGVHALLTDVASVVGTPAYMAPEQAAGEAVDARTDQYALALTLLDALLGQSPVRRDVPPTAPAAALDAALAHARLGPPVRGALARALSPEPAARFASVDDFLRALTAPEAAPPLPRRRRRAAVVGAVGIAGAGAIAAYLAVARTGAGCTVEAPERWTTAARTATVAALSVGPAAFAGWEAERVAAAIDRAVEDLAAGERARCEATGRTEDQACLARREAALATAVTALSATTPPEDPWGLVRTIAGCDAVGSPGSGELRRGLRGATPDAARATAVAAQRAGDDLLVAEAYETAVLAGLAAGESTSAIDDDLRAMLSAGERPGSDAVRGRALLRQIEVARWRGDYKLAKNAHELLTPMVGHHHDAPRDVLAVALVEGPAFTDLGDAGAAFAAWDRARTAAAALGDHDAALTAAVGRAWATYVLRLDLAGARSEAEAALAAGALASPAARVAALDVVADLALAARDGARARTATDEANRLAPARAALSTGRLRGLRARALLGEVDRVLAELVPAPSDDKLTAMRIAIARGKVLLAADRPGEARDVLDKLATDYALPRNQLPNAERLDLDLAACDAEVAVTGACKVAHPGLRASMLYNHAAVQVRISLMDLRAADATTPPYSRMLTLQRARSALLEAQADPVQIAELGWQLAQLAEAGTDRERRQLALDARTALARAGRTADVAAIDAWLTEHPGAPAEERAAGSADEPVDDHEAVPLDAAPAAAASKRDPWGPQP